MWHSSISQRSLLSQSDRIECESNCGLRQIKWSRTRGECSDTELDRGRRSVENLFQTVTENYECEIQTLGYPKAALFSFCLAIVAYNILATVRAALASVHGVGKISAGLSDYYMVDEAQATYRGMMIAIPPSTWYTFTDCSLNELGVILKNLAGQVRLSSFLKQTSAPKKKKKPPSYNPRHPHVSTAKLLEAARSSRQTGLGLGARG